MNRTIVHLSDLHFGRIDPATLDPLAATIGRIEPDLIAVSGDLTQRARDGEFAQARTFLDRLTAPRIVVPGNHDVSLHNPWRRFVSKWAQFGNHLHDDPGGVRAEQSFSDEAIAAIGINTARALAWKGGRISVAQIGTVARFFSVAPAAALKVLVVHHPLDIPREWAASNRSRRSRRALESWAGCGIDLILAGHAHRAFAGADASALRMGNHRALIVQAGTATSTRGRGEANSFNAIDVSASEMVVRRFTWHRPGDGFSVTHEDRFSRNP